MTLSFWTLFDGGDGANMQTLVDEFNKTHPDIEVKNTKLAWASTIRSSLLLLVTVMDRISGFPILPDCPT
ncbi:hypothetical protein [Paenibacillus sp. 1A_MP2]|uniref:hypothetical protein n=1 Tax=Paenibacillus sp. 1A_MP2 TaxID=3457495 RepID=UPI003FCCB1E6